MKQSSCVEALNNSNNCIWFADRDKNAKNCHPALQQKLFYSLMKTQFWCEKEDIHILSQCNLYFKFKYTNDT